MKKRYLLCIVVLVFLLLMTVGISVERQNEQTYIVKNIEEKTELTIVIAERDITWNAVMDYVIAEFEGEYPDIRIRKRADDPNVLYETYLRRLASTGQMGDIVEIRNTDYFTFGYMASLPPELADLEQKNYQEEGKVYGINCDISTVGIVYNKKIFRQLGIEVPETYREFLLVCEELKKKGYQPIIAAGGDLWYMKYWINQFYTNDVILKEPEWEMKLQRGEASWKDENVRNMFLHLYEVFHNYVQIDWQTDKDSQMLMKMTQGKSAMLLGEPWYFTEIYKQNPSMELGWFLLPDEEGRTCARIIDEKYFGISTECAQDEERFAAAVKFLEYYFSPEIYAYVCRQMKSVLRLSQDDGLSTVDQEMKKVLQDSDMKSVAAIDDSVFPMNLQNGILTAVMSFLKDEITLDQALERCEESYWKEYYLEQPEE